MQHAMCSTASRNALAIVVTLSHAYTLLVFSALDHPLHPTFVTSVTMATMALATAWALALVLLTQHAVPATAPSPSNLSFVLSGTSGGFQEHVIGLLNRMQMQRAHVVTGSHPELTLQEFEERTRTARRKWDVRGRTLVAEQSAIPHLVGYAVAGTAVLVASLLLLPLAALMLIGRRIVLLLLLCLGLMVFGFIVYAPFFLIEVILEMLDTDVWQANG